MGLITIRTEVTDRYVMKMVGLTDTGGELAVMAHEFRRAMLDRGVEPPATKRSSPHR